MNLLFSCHAAATWALVGLIWTIQLVHYPLFAQAAGESFKTYHQRHTTRITWIVAPLMLAESFTAMGLLIAGSRDPWLLASLAPLAFNWLSTWRVQIPLHDKLAAGFDPRAHQRLVATNWWRTAAWTLRGISLLLAAHESSALASAEALRGLVAPAPFTAELHLQPHRLPFLAPCEGAPADHANLGGKIPLVNTPHGAVSPDPSPGSGGALSFIARRDFR